MNVFTIKTERAQQVVFNEVDELTSTFFQGGSPDLKAVTGYLAGSTFNILLDNRNGALTGAPATISVVKNDTSPAAFVGSYISSDGLTVVTVSPK